MDIVKLMAGGFDWAGQRVARVRVGQLHAPTPCAAWNLRELLNHMLGAMDQLADTAAGNEDATRLNAQRLAETDVIGTDPARAFGEIAARALAVWHRDGALERSCVMPFGSVPGLLVARISLSDAVVHGWDISRATGENAPIPAELAEPLLEIDRELVSDDLRAAGAFGPRVELTNGSHTASDRLVAFLGRTP